MANKINQSGVEYTEVDEIHTLRLPWKTFLKEVSLAGCSVGRDQYRGTRACTVLVRGKQRKQSRFTHMNQTKADRDENVCQ